MKQTKSALIVSYGPVPTPQYQTIEGGGMRAWGIAMGLKAHDIAVTVAINDGFPQEYANHEGISLLNWSLDEQFKLAINSFDMVIMSYCMGDASTFIVENIEDSVTLVLDAYVPIYIEVSARNADDKKTELINYEQDIQRFNHVLLRGDYFLCANTPQKHMYTGILSSLGIINPVTYSENRILVVPFGIESQALTPLKKIANPYYELGITDHDFVLLWFGGLYPWFNFEPLIGAIHELAKDPNFKFVLVGGKNPYNSHPDFIKQYEHVKKSFDESQLLGKSVFLVDWVDYTDRIKWYQGATAVISINQSGEENIYSWRTRVMDYVWGSVPMLTNGGDPLSDQLINSGGAVKIETTQKSITQTIYALLKQPATLDIIRDRLHALRETFYWEKVVDPFIKKILANPHPYNDFKTERLSWGVPNALAATAQKPTATNIIAKLPAYYTRARQKGLKRSALFALSIAKSMATSKVKSLQPSNAHQKVVLLSHPIDETGAPLVLLDIAKDFSKHFSPRDVHIVSPDIKKHILKGLITQGFSIKKMAAGISGRIIQAQLNIQPDDFVLMNTVALYENYRTYVYWMLESGRLKHAHWFIHEDNPALQLTNMGEVERARKLIHTGRLSIHVPSTQTAQDYNKFFSTKSVQAITLRVEIPKTFTKVRSAKDFDAISFVTSGSPWDGRKGQFLLLNALLYFENRLRQTHKEYRPYEVSLLALGDDYISNQLISTGQAFFGSRFHPYEKVPRDKALEITNMCNVTVCSSLNETFALFVAEGMAMGHPIIRNKSSGWIEQIHDKKNGYLFDSLDLKSLAEKIELILDISINSNSALAAMGKESQKISQKFAHADYYDQLTK